MAEIAKQWNRAVGCVNPEQRSVTVQNFKPTLTANHSSYNDDPGLYAEVFSRRFEQLNTQTATFDRSEITDNRWELFIYFFYYFLSTLQHNFLTI